MPTDPSGPRATLFISGPTERKERSPAVSFFDEDDEPPRRTVTRPRRPAPARSSASGRGGAAASDRQQLIVRQAAAAGIGLLVIVILALSVRSCANTRQQEALRDYNRTVALLVEESDTQVAEPLFDLLTRSGQQSPNDQQVAASQLRQTAASQLDRARRMEVPEEVVPAQRSLLIALELRRDGVARIARLLPAAAGDENEEAVQAIAGQMAAFLASDVLHSQRVIPFIKKALDDAEVEGQTIAQSSFLPDVSWLSERTVANRVGGTASAGGGRSNTGDPAPGLHGTNLVSVSLGDTVLTPGTGAANRIPAADDLAFAVKFKNSGENDEFDVRTIIRLDGGEGDPIRLERTIDMVAQGTEATASIPLTEAPPIGTPVKVDVEVRPVPGEENTDNNKQTYQVFFTR